MSCFVVPDFHIDALVSWAADNGAAAFVDGLTPSQLARKLFLANALAYRERYGEAVPLKYKFTRVTTDLEPVAVLKACDCLEYQCSDWSDWSASVQDRALARIRDRAIICLPGYRSAAWTLEETASCA